MCQTCNAKLQRQTESKFPSRIRFNWGFHDAATDRRRGWTRRDNLTEANIEAKHPDKAYASGYVWGTRYAREGRDTTSSEPAWQESRA